MRRTLLLLMAAMLCATSVRAGVNLFWEECGGEGGSVLETFSCDTNEGTHTLVASFVPVADITPVALEAVVDFCSMYFGFPDWWQLGEGGCRSGALLPSADFTTSPGITCADPWHGNVNTYANYSMHPGSWNTARITVAVWPLFPPTLQAGTEYYGFKLRISSQNTVGDSSCAGCSTPICLVLNQINLVDAQGGQQPLSQPAINMAGHWQQVLPGCPFVVPTRASTWGMIKGMYR